MLDYIGISAKMHRGIIISEGSFHCLDAKGLRERKVQGNPEFWFQKGNQIMPFPKLAKL